MPRLIFTLALLAALLPTHRAAALIEGGDGNKPITDPGWPAGAAAVFNNPARAAFWEGPPFGGGQWHAECRGDAKQFSAVLADFAKIESPKKRLVLHEGAGQSFWLNTNRDPAKKQSAAMDWSFTVWQLANWKQLQKLPRRFRGPTPNDGAKIPGVQIDVYTGGSIHWPDVKVPAGIDVVDERLVAHGFKLEDGTVLEGKVTTPDHKPLAARIELQLAEKNGDEQKYTVVMQTTADEHGHWLIKKVPNDTFLIVAIADGRVPRVCGYSYFGGEPGWHEFNTSLSKPATVSGLVVDDKKKPLADVEVHLDQVVCNDDVYVSTDGFRIKTDAKGRFKFESVPIGTSSIMVYKKGFVRPGLGEKIVTPGADVTLAMTPSASIRVKIDFGDAKRPEGYMVEMEPEGGNVVGSWGGSGNINDQNEMMFSDAPPGRYYVWGHPNPSSQKDHTERVTVDVQGGATVDVTLKAK